MKSFDENINMYQLNPTPPRKDDLQEYIDLYFKEKNDKYLLWFLHYYELVLNKTANEVVKKYSVPEHFSDIKECCIVAVIEGVKTYDINSGTTFITYITRSTWKKIHEYIRSMRTGYTVKSDGEYLVLRKIMRLYRKYGSTDDKTIAKIACEVNREEKTVREALYSGISNMNQVDIYSLNADNDEESFESIVVDYSLEPCRALILKERMETLIDAFFDLDPCEQNVVSTHLGLCTECFRLTQPKLIFEDIATNNEYSSAKTVENIYHKAIKKLKDAIFKK